MQSIRYLIALLAMVFVMALSGCVVSTNPNEVNVVVAKPIIFGHGGVEATPLTTGSSFIWPSTDVIPVKITPTVMKVSFDDYSSADNILLDFETAIQYRVTDPVALIKGFGTDWFNNNLLNQYASIVREEVKTQTMSDMMSNVKTSVTVDADVTAKVKALVASEHLPIQIMDITLGRAVPNAQVLSQMNETAAQQQRQKTLEAATVAENARKAEQTAKADADDAYRAKMGMSVDDYTRLQIAQIQADACAKAQSCTIIPPGAGVVLSSGK